MNSHRILTVVFLTAVFLQVVSNAKAADMPDKTCGPNMEYTDCGTACPDTCANFRDEHRACTLQCVQGCFCKQGFVMEDAKTKKCVDPRTGCASVPYTGKN